MRIKWDGGYKALSSRSPHSKQPVSGHHDSKCYMKLLLFLTPTSLQVLWIKLRQWPVSPFPPLCLSPSSPLYSSSCLFQHGLNWSSVIVLECTSFQPEHEKWVFPNLCLNSLGEKAQSWRRMTNYYSQLHKNWKVNIGFLDAKHYISSKICVKWFSTKNIK